MATLTNGFWVDRPVLVTGCTGLLGSHLCEILLREGASVVGIVRDSVPRAKLLRPGLLEDIHVVHGDVQDFSLVQRALNEYEVEVVFHLAAQTIVGTANRSPISTFETNIAGTWRLLEACRLSSKIKAVVVASSDKAYGDQKILPYKESTPLEGRYPYDVSKSCTDLISMSYYNTYRLPVCVTRCGNFYGPGDLNWNRIVPGTIRSVLRGNAPVIRSDGTPVRDYIYIHDGALAYRCVAEAIVSKGIAGEVFNFSNEQPLSVLELARKITVLMGRADLEPVILNQASHEIERQYLSAEKARCVLNWTPRYTLDTGLQETFGWYSRLLGNMAQDV